MKLLRAIARWLAGRLLDIGMTRDLGLQIWADETDGQVYLGTPHLGRALALTPDEALHLADRLATAAEQLRAAQHPEPWTSWPPASLKIHHQPASGPAEN